MVSRVFFVLFMGFPMVFVQTSSVCLFFFVFLIGFLWHSKTWFCELLVILFSLS